MSVMQDLYDSEINVATESFFDGGWHVRIGDQQNGFTTETIQMTWSDVESWLSEQAIARYPNSDFAIKYRPRAWRRPPHLTLVSDQPAR